MPEPIELKAGDLIQRPEGLTAKEGGVSPLHYLKQVGEALKQARQIVDQMQELGIDLGPLTKIAKHGPNPEEPIRRINQVQAFAAVLQAKFGDLTLAEALEKLKQEYGDTRLSQVAGRGLLK